MDISCLICFWLLMMTGSSVDWSRQPRCGRRPSVVVNAQTKPQQQQGKAANTATEEEAIQFRLWIAAASAVLEQEAQHHSHGD
jgi:hypothetical protein